MASYNVHEAKSGLSRLLKETEQGEEVIIMRNGEPVAKLVPYRRKRQKKIKLGFAAGLVKEIDKDWWKPMSDEEVDALFEGRL
jgi:prevent-host-death family protein